MDNNDGIENCFIKTSLVIPWWNSLFSESSTDTRMISTSDVYTAIILSLVATFIAFPAARIMFYTLSHVLKHKKWATEVETSCSRPTGSLIQISLLWAAAVVINLSPIFCQWPLWIFGIPLLLWLNAIGNIVANVVSRKYSRKDTLYREGALILKRLLLVFVFYIIYLGRFNAFRSNVGVTLLITGTLFINLAFAASFLVFNLWGTIYLFFNNQLLDSIYNNNSEADENTSGLSFVSLSDSVTGTTVSIPGSRFLNSVLQCQEKQQQHCSKTKGMTTLDIRLPPRTSSGKVRHFIQDVEYLLKNQECCYVSVESKWVLRVHNLSTNAGSIYRSISLLKEGFAF